MMPRTWSKLVTSALLAAASGTVLLGLLGCGGGTPDLSSTAAVVAVETVPAQVRSIANVITADGVLYPIDQASISPKITAPVKRFYVQRGDHVHAGQLLAVLENQDLAASLVSAEGSYDQAKANYASTTSATLPEEIQTAKLNLTNAKTNLNAQQELYKSEQNLYKQGAIARKQLDATQVALTTARSAYQTAQKHLKTLEATGASQQRRAAKGQLEIAHGQYQSAAAQLAYTQIRSPIAGSVADRAVYPGDVAPAGTPLLIVMDTSKVIVRIHAPEAQAALLKLGDAATLQVPGFQKTFPAKVTVISPAVDPNSTTVEVWVQADNPKRELKPGATVSVSITAGTVSNALVVPASAILTAADGATTVMVVKSDSRAYSQKVKTGIEEGKLTQIVSGLQPGEQIISSGAYGLPDKTKVKATPASPATYSQASGS